jgi:hypothetical protein
VTSADPYQVRPSARWYAAVVAAWVIAAVCLFFAVKPLWGVLDVTPIPIDNRASVGVSDDGLTVYAPNSVSSAAACTVTDGTGNVFPLDSVAATSTFEVTGVDGTRMYPIATTPKDLASGTYTLRCAGVGAQLLGFGDRIDFDAVLLQIGGMFILSGLFGVAGLIVLIVVLVKRHNSRNRMRWAQAAYAGWGQWYASPYGGYPAAGAYPGYPQQQAYPAPGYGQPTYPQPGWSYGQPYGEPPPTSESPTGESSSDRAPDDRA